MSISEKTRRNFSMQHLLTPHACTTTTTTTLTTNPIITTSTMITEHGDVLDLCVRKREHCATPPASSPSPAPSTESNRMTPDQKVFPDPPHTTMCFSSPSSQAGSESSDTSHNEYTQFSDGAEQKPKVPRPFKAFPKDPLSIAYGVVTPNTILTKDTAEAYAEFRQKMLSRVHNQTPGTNIKMRRTTHQNSNLANADPTYWEKRRKNNEAAKRSRDARRAKEDEIAIRCAFLEQENLRLRFEVSTMRHEMERMRGVLNVPSY